MTDREISAEEYTQLIEGIYLLTKRLFESWLLEYKKGLLDLHNIVLLLPAVICLTNTISYLRGDNGIFLNIRPHGIRSQDKFYKYEEEIFNLRKELVSLIKPLSKNEKKALINKLQTECFWDLKDLIQIK